MLRHILGLAGLLLLSVSSTLHSQEIGGVTLGETTIDEVRSIRGRPYQQGLLEDGGAYYLRYNEYAFYFAGPDSVAIAARVLPDGMTRDEVEDVFGEPEETSRRPDLSVAAVYADTLAVQYDRDGERVHFLEYSLPSDELKRKAAAWRFIELADSLRQVRRDSIDSLRRARRDSIREVRDSVREVRQKRARKEIKEKIAGICRSDEGVPELEEWNEMFEDLRDYAPRLISRYRLRLLKYHDHTCKQVLAEMASDTI